MNSHFIYDKNISIYCLYKAKEKYQFAKLLMIYEKV